VAVPHDPNAREVRHATRSANSDAESALWLVARTCESIPGMLEHDVTAALSEWGAHHRDDPFELFTAVRQRGAVHPVTLVDGHDAWLVVHHDEARAALNLASLSKDMHAALAGNAAVVSEGLPGPAFARHMLTVDPPDHTRLRRLVSSAFTPRRIELLEPRHRWC
jgi:cytochrome P450